ncbi:MAG: hypothetical protein Q4E57_00735 [Eubacteriales bacterium]|nr:hypothetical protein [Eubacteriales bacterium]
MFNFFRILFLALYVLCFLTAFAAYYTASVVYRQGADTLSVAVWVIGGVILTVLAILLYRVYRNLAGR